MIQRIFSIIVSALFLMGMFWILWYVAVPLLAVIVIVSAFGLFVQKIKQKTIRQKVQHHPIRAHDIIDVDFKEVN